MFYVAYLRAKKNGGNFLVTTTLLGLCVIGLTFFTALLLLIGVTFDIGIMKLLITETEIGAPMVFIGPLITLSIFLNLSVRNNSYQNYKTKYPDISLENLDTYDRKYLLTPAVSSTILLFISVYITFETGRGV